MDYRKISLDPEELQKLKNLLKEEEARVDELSDDELEAAEQELSLRIKNLPILKTTSLSGFKDSSLLDASWQKFQNQLNASARREVAQDEAPANDADNVVSIFRPKKKLPWTTISVFAAAALALLIFYPALKQDHMDPDSLGMMQTKGTGSGEYAYTGFCDVDVRGQSAEAVEEAGSGRGYDVAPGETFQISVSCDKPGYIQIWSKTTPASEVRDSPVTVNQRTFVIEDGKAATFSLSGSTQMTLEIALTDKEIKDAVNLYDAALTLPVTKLGDSAVLWTDSLEFRGKSK